MIPAALSEQGMRRVSLRVRVKPTTSLRERHGLFLTGDVRQYAHRRNPDSTAAVECKPAQITQSEDAHPPPAGKVSIVVARLVIAAFLT
jgi:hypothetical protein